MDDRKIDISETRTRSHLFRFAGQIKISTRRVEVGGGKGISLEMEGTRVSEIYLIYF